MQLSRTKQARRERKAAARADRARGLTYRQIARWHGVSVALAYYLAADVYVVLPNPWHRARCPKETPAPPLPQVHRLLLT